MELKHGQFCSEFTLDSASLLLCGETAYTNAEDFQNAMSRLGEEGQSRELLFSSVVSALTSWYGKQEVHPGDYAPDFVIDHHGKQQEIPHSLYSTITRAGLILWHEENDLKLPGFLKGKLSATYIDTPSIFPETGETAGKKLRNNQRRKERCRAISEMLWDEDPKLTQGDIITNPLFVKYGRENAPYTEKALKEWIKDLDPEPQIGRPLKS